MQQRNDPELDVSTISPANCCSFDVRDVPSGSLTKPMTQVRKGGIVRGAGRTAKEEKCELGSGSN